jgi:hypothetical protein
MEILVPISLGELYDKISILLIKKEKINDSIKLENIQKELDLLQDIAEEHPIDGEFHTRLHSANNLLWLIEDEIRLKEKNQEFNQEFIKLARSVYYHNDERSEIKREINLKYGSVIIEEKSYEKY